MKCPKCKEQTLKEDYSDKSPTSDRLYCPNCDFTESRAIVSAAIIKRLEDQNEKLSEENEKLREWIKARLGGSCVGCDYYNYNTRADCT